MRRELRLATNRLWAVCHPKPHDWEEMTFSQKVQWRCSHPDPMLDYASWVDKYRAKALVARLFPVPRTYAVVRLPQEILAIALPATFVMKATHGYNMSLLVQDGIVQGTNRSTKDADSPAESAYLCDLAAEWMHSKDQERRRELQRHYGQVDFGVLFEDYVCPVDYEVQFFLFAGQFKLALVFFRQFVFKRPVSHQIYDEEWILREASAIEKSGPPAVPRPPASLFEALERLCRYIDHVRVDFMVSNGRYYFSEFTFTHNGLCGPGLIASFDAELGRYWAR